MKSNRDPELTVQLVLWIGVIIAILAALSMTKCTPSQRHALKSGLVSVGDCSLHTSIGCASQAAYDCPSPGINEGYKDYAHCVTRNSAACAGAGLARCLLGEVRSIFNRSPIITMHTVSGSRGCSGEEDLKNVLHCVNDVSEIVSELEAVHTVAACYRRICVGE